MAEFVKPIILTAVSDLQHGLSVYWPTERNNEMPEAHALGALGRAFGNAGFLVFAEVQCVSQNRIGHIDLFAFHQENSVGIAIEGKRLYDGRGASTILSDWRRLEVSRLAKEHGVPEIRHRYRMVLATTWQENIKEWWSAHSTHRDRSIHRIVTAQSTAS